MGQTTILRRRCERTPLLVETGSAQRANLCDNELTTTVPTTEQHAIIGGDSVAALIRQRTKTGNKEFVSLCEEMFHDRLSSHSPREVQQLRIKIGLLLPFQMVNNYERMAQVKAHWS